MDHFDALRAKIDGREATVGIIGMGYVGLPLASALHSGGLRVLGFDVDSQKIEDLTAGRNYLQHLGDAMTATLAASERFEATSDFLRLDEPDVTIVCLPTPIGPHQEPDLSYVELGASQIGRRLRAGQLLILESTTYPGTTRDVFLAKILEGAGDTPLTPGEDFFVAYSPEREDPGSASHSTRTIPKLVGGLSDRATQLAASVYRIGVEQVVEVANAEVAESAKLLENIFRAVNIALVNEMKIVLDRLGIDIWDVVDAASTKPFGFMPFYPGPGLGGHCIPIDPFYLSWKAREVGSRCRFIELAGEVNTSLPGYVVEQTIAALNSVSKPVKGARVLVLGLAYKADVDDTRESPSFELIERLRKLGATVDYSDPHIPRTKPTRRFDLGMESQELNPENVSSYDVVLIATAHRDFDYGVVAEHAPLIVDTRGVMRQFQLGDRLVRA